MLHPSLRKEIKHVRPATGLSPSHASYHIVTSNVVKHLDQQKIHYGLQHDFCARRSCETQLTMLIEEIHQNLSDGKQTDVILPERLSLR